MSDSKGQKLRLNQAFNQIIETSLVFDHLSPCSVRLYVSIYHRAVFVCTSPSITAQCSSVRLSGCL